MSDVIFMKHHMRNYDVIKEPCTAIVTVANTVKPQYLIEDGSKSRYLVNLKVGELSLMEEVIKILNGREECSFTEVAHCFIAGVIWEKELISLENLPVKGEQVIASFDRDIDGIMRCVSLTLIPRKELQKFDLDAYNFSKRKLGDLLKQLAL